MFLFSLLLLLFGAFSLCDAHHMLTNIHINGVDQGDGVCVRIPPNTNPLTNVKAAEMACNIGGEKALNKFCTVDAGAAVTFEWRTWPDGSMNTPIDVSHQGPCAVYMKRVNSFGDAAAGSGWFKIWNYGFENGMFCTDVLRANGGMMTFTIPKDLAGGRYLLRGEHLALHEAQDVGGAQWYIGCAQIAVYSTGGPASPPAVSIPGYVNANDPGVHFDYWANTHPKSYTIPGPAPYVPTNTGGGQRIPATYPQKYTSCQYSNADWCSVPLPNYNNERSCWASVSNCWGQLDNCYNNAAATGHTGCTDYEAACTFYQSCCGSCNRNCVGPFPNPPPSVHKRAEHIYPILPILERDLDGVANIPKYRKHHLHRYSKREPTAAISISEANKLVKARQLCDTIAVRCKEGGVGALCEVFGAACRGAVTPSVINQFPENSGRKWQALWLYQMACEKENFEKDECREKFSKVVWGFE